ncbi:hypothetical protein [uncultured Microbacterium sp.]|uniref:hypothetical protein n=1 Tax=uncultured Microbacterium sp. TaxID=191216 RepID=UPI0025FBB539|nr:hypothetical protein [uncultured Microbacterium sp.]
MELWISTASSLILVGVTAWYAVLTRSLARSAKESAASAERAAQVAADALAASVASVDVDFRVSPWWRFDEGSTSASALGMTVQSTGATVFVHGARIDELWVREEREGDLWGESLEVSGRNLVLDTSPDGFNLPGMELPVRLHRGEVVHLSAEPVINVEDREIGHIEIRVLYSLDQNGPWLTRHKTYDREDE